MTAAVTILGPCSCRGCGTRVKWVRLWDNTLWLLNAEHRGAGGAIHECRWVKSSAA